MTGKTREVNYCSQLKQNSENVLHSGNRTIYLAFGGRMPNPLSHGGSD